MSGILKQAVGAAIGVAMVGFAQADTASLYGRADGVVAPTLSPSGEKVAMQCAPQGAPSLCVFDIVNGGEPQYVPLSASRRLGNFYWANDTYLIFDYSTFEALQTADGMKEYDFYRAAAYDTETGEAAMLMNDNRAMLDTSQVVALMPGKDRKVMMQVYSYNTSRATNRFTQLKTDDDAPWSLAMMEVDLKSGKSKRKKTLSPEVIQTFQRPDGTIIAQLLQIDHTTGDRRRDYKVNVGRKTIFEAKGVEISDFSVLGYDAASGALIVFFNTAERSGLFQMALDDGALSPVTIDGTVAGRAAPIIDRHTQSLVGLSYTNDLEVQVFLDPKMKTMKANLEKTLAGKSVALLSWDASKTRIVVRAEAPGRPADFYVFNSASGELGGLGNRASHLTDVETGSVEAVSYAARDGKQIPAYVTLPPGKVRADGPFPLVVMPHGGPAARDTAAFDWWSQALAAEGYAVLQPNFRGSTGYGYAHQAAGYGEFGGAMVADVADGAAWAEAQGIAVAGGYCAVGASYGGYSALMLAATDGARLGCAVSVNGVTDPFLLKARFPDGSETSNYLERYLGATQFAEDDVRNAITPRRRGSDITDPVLVLHGTEDLRVRIDQARTMAQTMEGKPGFRFVEIPGEDHFLQTSEVRNTVLTETLSFLGAHHPAR